MSIIILYIIIIPMYYIAVVYVVYIAMCMSQWPVHISIVVKGIIYFIQDNILKKYPFLCSWCGHEDVASKKYVLDYLHKEREGRE